MSRPEVTVFEGRDRRRLSFALAQGGRVCLSVLGPGLLRVLFLPDGAPRIPKTWSFSQGGQDCPWQGRDRLEDPDLPAPDFTFSETEQGLAVETGALSIAIGYRPFRIDWSLTDPEADAPVPLAADRVGDPYDLDPDGALFHAMARRPADRFYGLGDKTGHLNRAGRRFRMQGMDALGYDAELSDPLYKHIPFLITRDAATGACYGLFYDNLASAVFDLGCEIDNCHGPYRYYQAETGDLDYYFLLGPRLRDVVTAFARLTGPMAFGPKWGLGFSGSTMALTETDQAEADVLSFAAECGARDIPCEGFQLSSGYTTIGDRRHVFHWNTDRFPDPAGFCKSLRRSGVQVTANVKPCLLEDNPLYADAAAQGLFIRHRETGAPVTGRFWGGVGAHLDFTNPATVAWWKAKLGETLLDKGVAASWNDNNEYPVWDAAAVCEGFGTPMEVRAVRPLLGTLMARASAEAQAEHAPELRPHLVSRAGGPGLQRYAQTWTGDNATAWKTLKYNIRMGLGLSLSGQFNVGHDVGGFTGPPPGPELLVRWVQNGIFHPRFVMHSRNDDGSTTLPWMHDDVADLVRDAIQFRYHLMPYLYTLYHRAHRDHEPIIRPTFYAFEADPRSFLETDDFMLGDQLLVASVVEPGATERSVYLPKGPDGWVDVHHGRWYGAGKRITVPAPLEVIPLFVPDGAILPLNANPRPVSPLQDTARMLWIFPHRREGKSAFRLYEDDGETTAYRRGHFCEIEIVLETTPQEIHLFAHREGVFEPGYSSFDVVLPPGERRPVRLNGWPVDRLTEPLVLTI